MTSRTRLAICCAALALLAGACAPGSTAPSTDATTEVSGPTTEAAGGATATAEDTDYPTREITLTVVYPAGSAPDSTARTLAAVLEEELGQPVVVVNAEGGNGIVGLTQVAAAQPDGYTIAFTASPPLEVSWQLTDTGFAGPEAIQPVAQTNEVPSVLFVNGDSEIQTIEDFAAAARERPVTVGIPGEASIQRFQMEGFLREADITVDQIITDAGQQVLGAVNGTTDAAIAQPAPILQYVERGDLRMIGYFGERKPADLDVPSFQEEGYEIPYGGFEGFVAPNGIPQPVLARLEEAVAAAVESQEFQDYIRGSFGVAAYLDAAALEQRLTEETERYTQAIEELGLGG